MEWTNASRRRSVHSRRDRSHLAVVEVALLEQDGAGTARLLAEPSLNPPPKTSFFMEHEAMNVVLRQADRNRKAAMLQFPAEH